MELTKPQIKKILSKNLRNLRKERGVTQKEIANYLQIDRSTYTCYETCKAEPSIFILKKLSLFYNVDIQVLLKGIF